MARGLVISSQTRAASATTTSIIFRASTLISPSKFKLSFLSLCHCPHHLLRAPRFLHSTRRFFCNSLHALQAPVDVSQYKEAFFRRMAMAGLQPHHQIALGVSGGPDSMALCVLTAAWKMEGPNAVGKSGGFIDGLLAIIVDHGLRAESKEEANFVSHRVSKMGIRCEIAHCDWPDGRPKQGHLQAAARDMRYQKFQHVCVQHQIGVLLIAHHADDQAELFILRLSRNSGVLGLACMAFTSQMFASYIDSCGEGLKRHDIFLLRPFLDFSKEDMYKICQGANQDWVEDPTNQSSLYARNRIRMSLGNLSSCIFNSELQAIIAACQKTRAYVDQVCCNLISQAVKIMDLGYAVIDLELLNPSKVEEICMSKFVALVLQFISQRHRPVRGGTSKLLLDYIRTFPCKNSFTAAGCYLCPAPGCKGTKVLVCCSVDCPLPSKMELFKAHSVKDEKDHITCELETIIANGKPYSDNCVLNVSDVQFLDVTSGSVLTEAKRLNILSDSTYRNILLLQREEIKHFKPKTVDACDDVSKLEVESVSTSISESLQPGQICYFMNRFLVTWKPKYDSAGNICSGRVYCDQDLDGENHHCSCSSCVVGPDLVVEVRHMIESDWLYLAKLSKCLNLESVHPQRVVFANKLEEIAQMASPCCDFVRISAQRALRLLKLIPVAARRSLPVIVNHQGLLLSIPSIGFKHCPCITVSAVFSPRVPLGGGHSSFV